MRCAAAGNGTAGPSHPCVLRRCDDRLVVPCAAVHKLGRRREVSGTGAQHLADGVGQQWVLAHRRWEQALGGPDDYHVLEPQQRGFTQRAHVDTRADVAMASSTGLQVAREHLLQDDDVRAWSNCAEGAGKVVEGWQLAEQYLPESLVRLSLGGVTAPPRRPEVILGDRVPDTCAKVEPRGRLDEAVERGADALQERDE